MGDDICVRDLMTRDVHTLDRNDEVANADALIRQARIRHLVVVDPDGGEVVGVLSQRDMFRGALARTLGYGEHAQERIMHQLRVKDLMTRDPVTIRPDEPIAKAAEQMLELKIGCLPVVEDGRLVGILSESDFVRAFAERR